MGERLISGTDHDGEPFRARYLERHAFTSRWRDAACQGARRLRRSCSRSPWRAWFPLWWVPEQVGMLVVGSGMGGANCNRTRATWLLRWPHRERVC